MSRADNARKRYEEMVEQSKASGGFEERVKLNYLTFKDKETKILRILPVPEALAWYLENDEGEYTKDAFPVGEFFKHWKVGPNKAQLSCLSKHNNEPCPVCELIEELKGTGDKDDKEYASDMWASGRYAWFAIDRADCEDEKWFVWEVSNTVSSTLLSKLSNAKIPELDHVFEGTDIEVTRHGAKGDRKTKYEIDDVREVSFLYTNDKGEFDYERAEKLLDKLADAREYSSPFLNYDETKAVMQGEGIKDVLKARNSDNEEEPEATEKPRGRGRGRGRG